MLTVTKMRCLPALCRAMLGTAADSLRQEGKLGEIRPLGDDEFSAETRIPNGFLKARLFALPTSLQVWFFTRRGMAPPPEEWLTRLTPLIERERREEGEVVQRVSTPDAPVSPPAGPGPILTNG